MQENFPSRDRSGSRFHIQCSRGAKYTTLSMDDAPYFSKPEQMHSSEAKWLLV
jgi:hypothetical protein